MSSPLPLLTCLSRLAQLQNEPVDRLALQEAVAAATVDAALAPMRQLHLVARHLQIGKPRQLAGPDAALTPALMCSHGGEWGILRGKNAHDHWISEWWDSQAGRWREQADATLIDPVIATFRLARPFSAATSPVYQRIRDEVFSHGRLIREAIIGGMMINTVAMAASFYSMQVYDRVIPTGAVQTLLVLTLGVLAAALFELLAKGVRTALYEQLIDQVDQRLARAVYMRFLAIRLDQLPQSVGGLAAQLRGYETVRSFFTANATNFIVDAPFALIFSFVIWSIGGWLALVPLGFFLLCVGIALFSRARVEALAGAAMADSNRKAGLLVETVEGAETIKAGHGGWRMLTRWMRTTDAARSSELEMRRISEHTQHLTAASQQASYVLLVALGALLVSRGELSIGALIAASILSGRVLAPVAMIPAHLVQWAHAKAALQGLDQLWRLEDDHQGQAQPLVLDHIRGHYRFESVVFHYRDKMALSVPALRILPGEKVGVLGPVGAGKTTLLRLIGGLYKPQQGRILLDDVDLAQLAKPLLAENLAYVQQDGRLFAGSLRENLILGQLDPGDDTILDAARRTGLLQAVIAPHPQGLQQEIYEGGSGLSGGQRQLVNLTRAFLRKPVVWLLDEPTASMDRQLESQVTDALGQAIRASDTLILVTHKAEMLALVDRLIVIAQHQIVLDGPRDQILARLQAAPLTAQEVA